MNENGETVVIENEYEEQSSVMLTDLEKFVFQRAVNSYSSSLVIYDRVDYLVIERHDIFDIPQLFVSKINDELWLIQYLKFKYTDNVKSHTYLIEKEYLWEWKNEKPVEMIKRDILNGYIKDTNPIIYLEK